MHAPALARQAERRALHHSLGDGEFGHFLTMHTAITCARAALTPDNAVSEIDRVLTEVRDKRLPGYLLVPADVAQVPAVPAARPLPPHTDTTDPAALEAFVDAARRLLERAGSVADVGVLAGLLGHRFGAAPQLRRLLATGVPHATTPWAKSLVDESAPAFAGTYSGATGSTEDTRRTVEDAAALILAGVQFTDLNSGLFSQRITRAQTIELGARSASVGAAAFAPLELPTALAALEPLVAGLDPATPPPAAAPEPQPAAADDAVLGQATLWQETAAFLRAGDIVLADQGTCFYGMAPHRLPADVTFVGQPLWASIGYTLPALLGACIAAPGRRGVLLIGDGAAQLTVQELATVVAHRVPAVVVVVDNDGYTVERAIHGPDEPYNDITRWDWSHAPAFFGADGDGRAVAARVRTVGELRAAFADATGHPGRLSLIQAVVPRDDVPELLDTLTRALGRAPAPAP